MNKATIRNLASAVILAEHPELDGLVEFDIEFFTAAPFMCGFYLIIHLDGSDAWKTLQTRLGYAGRHFITLEGVLDHYRVTEATKHFEYERCKWLIGDGDDQGALRAEGHTCRLWVRTWWESAE